MLKHEFMLIDIEIHHAETRLDVALLKALKLRKIFISRNELKKKFQNQEILLGGEPSLPSKLFNKGKYTIQILGSLEAFSNQIVACPSKVNTEFAPVYEDPELIILSKPSGIPSAPLSTNENETAVGMALSRVPSLIEIGVKKLEAGLVHRLDTGTSGLLVFAKNQKEFERMRHLWRTHQVKKTYRAWVTGLGNQPPRISTLDFKLAHHPKSKKKMVILPHQDRGKKTPVFRGKPIPATTHILSIHQQSQNLYDLTLQIETGVMHQIRIHLSSQGWPILGDRLYQGTASSRIWLHAWRLSFPLKTGVQLDLESLLPENWDHPA